MVSITSDNTFVKSKADMIVIASTYEVNRNKSVLGEKMDSKMYLHNSRKNEYCSNENGNDLK